MNGILGGAGIGKQDRHILLFHHGRHHGLHVGILHTIHLGFDAKELIGCLKGGQKTGAHPEKADSVRLSKIVDGFQEMLRIQKGKCLSQGIDISIEHLLRQFLKRVLQADIAGKPLHVLAVPLVKAQGQHHLKLLIPLQIHGLTETEHTGVPHITGLGQVRDGHKQHILGMLQDIIRHFLFRFCKLIIYRPYFYQKVSLHSNLLSVLNPLS